MIGRRLDNNTPASVSSLAVAFIAILAFGASTDDVVEAARLRRGASGVVRKPTMPKAASSSSSSLRVHRRTEEEEENELLMKLEKEYHLEEGSRKDAMEDAMAMHNRILSDEDALAEMHELDSSLQEEEQQHQLRAKEEASEEEKKSLFDYLGLEESLRKNKDEFEKYQDKLLEIKKRDEKLIRDVDEAMKQEEELKDATDQSMHEHMHGNDEFSAMIDEQSIQNIHEEEMKLQEEYHLEKMGQEQKSQEEYLRRIELEQQTLDLLLGRK
jgi:hypothetical protein